MFVSILPTARLFHFGPQTKVPPYLEQRDRRAATFACHPKFSSEFRIGKKLPAGFASELWHPTCLLSCSPDTILYFSAHSPNQINSSAGIAFCESKEISRCKRRSSRNNSRPEIQAWPTKSR